MGLSVLVQEIFSNLAIPAWRPYPYRDGRGDIMGLGGPELFLIFAIVVVLFGTSRLPAIGEGIGKAISGLKRGLAEDPKIDVTPDEKKVSADGETDSSKDA